jgi:membrane protein YdbS with pleckstrin-like domain
MLCNSCGADASNESLFCAKCGARLDGEKGKDLPPNKAERFREAIQRDDDDLGDEQQLWEGGYSGKAMIGSWCLAGLLTIAFTALAVMVPMSMPVAIPLVILIWVFLGGLLAYRKISVHYELSTQRFIHKIGILKRVTDRIEVIDIDDVTYAQGIVQRMLGVGTITVTSSDRTHPELLLLGIDDVKRVSELIDDVRRKERRSRGVHIEAI